MHKVFNLFYIILIFFYFFYTYKYYSSNMNLKAKDFNRKNINQILNKKVSNLEILDSDTNNVIEFNNSLSNKINNDKPRSFWSLLKSK